MQSAEQRFWKRGQSSVDFVIRQLGLVSALALGLMMLVVSVHVLGRYLFNKPLTGSIELVQLLSVVVVFFAIVYAELMKKHVTVDAITRLMPRKVRTTLSSIMYFLCGLFFLVLAYQGAVLGVESILPFTNKTPILSIPVAPFQFVLAAGAFLLGIKMLLDCFLWGDRRDSA